jgi:Reverse transcriptase (RNA-dependent DNA polymerase)
MRGWAGSSRTARSERYADDGLIHCKSQARARQVLAALGQRMRDVGLELHPDKTRIIYCRDSSRRQPWDGPVSFDFLGYAFRPRDTVGKNGRFTGFDLAASPKAVKRMSETVTGWQLHRLTALTWAQRSSRRNCRCAPARVSMLVPVTRAAPPIGGVTISVPASVRTSCRQVSVSATQFG